MRPATVQLSLPAAASHVRTARLVSVSVARRLGFSDLVIDEIRLAVGEACATILADDQSGDVLRLEISDEDGSLTISVFAPRHTRAGSDDPVDSGGDLSLAMLQGLVPSLVVRPGRFELTWPSTDRA